MDDSNRGRKHSLINLGFLVVFGTAFGFVEAAVVYYLRALINFHKNFDLIHYKVLLNLGFITFISPSHSILLNNKVTAVEITREFATIVLLISVAYIAGIDLRHRAGAFLISFACWDITYYLFLKILDNWPSSLMTRDVYFLIPVTWIGPVITPLAICTVMLAIGIKLYVHPSARL
jgi:hypothetical protein